MTDEHLRKGLEATRECRRGEARSAFRAALKQQPDNETALLGLAYLARDPRARLVYIARALELRPASRRARAALHWAREQLSEPSDSLRPSPRHRQRMTRGAAMVALIALLVAALVTAFALDLPARAQLAVVPPTAMASLPPQLSPTVEGDHSGSSSEIPAGPPSSATPTIPGPSPTSTSTPTPSPNPSPTPTVTPSPTPTPIPPTPTPAPPPTATPIPPAPQERGRWIDVDLSQQTLVAYEGDTPVRTVIVSTGRSATPTVVGQFRIYVKYVYDDMAGPGYYLPDVPYVMYFYAGYGLHGTYWHNNFGQPMSHGCINLPTVHAQWLFNWAEVGTLVNIHY